MLENVVGRVKSETLTFEISRYILTRTLFYNVTSRNVKRAKNKAEEICRGILPWNLGNTVSIVS